MILTTLVKPSLEYAYGDSPTARLEDALDCTPSVISMIAES